jgi:drug/metabolite transporter (DMT)-like permease
MMERVDPAELPRAGQQDPAAALASPRVVTVPAPSRGNIGLAIPLRIGAGIAMVLMAVIVRRLSPEIPTGEIVFCRSAGALLVILAFLAMGGGVRAGFATARLGRQLARGLTGLSAMALNFLALAYLPLAQAQSIMYLTPLFTLVFVRLFLGEHIGAVRWLAVGLGFAGVLLMLPPVSFGAANDTTVIGLTVGLLGAALAAAALYQVKILTATESTASITIYFTLVSVVGSLATAGFGWVWPTPEQFVLLGLLGALGAIAHVMLTRALALADASLLAPLEYLNILWAVGLGVVFFDERPGAAILIGGAIITVASLLIVRTGYAPQRSTTVVGP